jgi:multidrug efflux pump subunit AcrA (membrane-fusion protein)
VRRRHPHPEGPLNQPLEASITVVDRDADAASGTFEVRLELPNPEHRVTAGLNRKVNFPGAPQR